MSAAMVLKDLPCDGFRADAARNCPIDTRHRNPAIHQAAFTQPEPFRRTLGSAD
jgi:hypothetical protein